MRKALIFGLALLFSISLVSAVSNVQHSVNGTKVTITFQGTPPFLINIRGDANIGQPGGYVWAKTTSNSFSYGMDFAKDPYGKFYFGVKDTEWSAAILMNRANRILSGEEAFLISNENWKDVLSLVPIAVRTPDYSISMNVLVHPLLIYHKEGDAFDVDSTMHFLRQYSPNKLIVVGQTPQALDDLLVSPTGGKLSGSQIERISVSDYLSYWTSQKEVYAEDDYTTALMASTYASLINAPLIIKGSTLDQPDNFNGKNVVLVGSVECPAGAVCGESYNLTALQAKYIELTKTNKAILVNPNDISFFVNETLESSLSATNVTKLYGETSLAAPILAAAKHEVLVFYKGGNLDGGVHDEGVITDAIGKVGQFTSAEFDRLTPPDYIIGVPGYLYWEYLTVFASPIAIPISKFTAFVGESGLGLRVDADERYGHGAKVGRIYSLTVSDVSSYVARSIFYNKLVRTNNRMLYTTDMKPDDDPGADEAHNIAIGQIVAYVSKMTGYDFACIVWTKNLALPAGCAIKTDYSIGAALSSVDFALYKNRNLILHTGHGSHAGWLSMDFYKLPELDMSFGLAWSCSTSDFYGIIAGQRPAEKKTIFSANWIRKGGIGYYGLITPGTDAPLGELPELRAVDRFPDTSFEYLAVSHPDATLGDLNKYIKDKYRYHHTSDVGVTGADQLNMLGDPTLKLSLKQLPGLPFVAPNG
jgi:hypothetical protein